MKCVGATTEGHAQGRNGATGTAAETHEVEIRNSVRNYILRYGHLKFDISNFWCQILYYSASVCVTMLYYDVITYSLANLTHYVMLLRL